MLMLEKKLKNNNILIYFQVKNTLKNNCYYYAKCYLKLVYFLF